MDFEGLTRRELQALCKKNKIPANQTNVAMAQALQALSNVEGIEVLSQLGKGFQTPAPSRTNQGATTRKKAEIPPGAVVIELEDSAAPVSRVKTGRRTAVKSSGFSRGVSLEEERVGETKNDADLELVQSPLLTGAATAKKATTKKDTKSLVKQSNLKVRRSTRLKSVYNATDEVPSVVSKRGNKKSAKVSELIEEPKELTENLAKEAGEETTCVEGEDEAGLFTSSNGVEELLEEPEEITENLAKEAGGEAATDIVKGVDEADLFSPSNGVKELLEESEEVTENLPKEAVEAATNVEGVVEAGLFSPSNGVQELIEEPDELTENLLKEAVEAATDVDGLDEANLFSLSNDDLQNPGGETESCSAFEVLDGVKELFEEPEELTENLPKQAEEAATDVKGVDEADLYPLSNSDLQNPGGETESCAAFEVLDGVKELFEEPEELTEDLPKEAGKAATNVVDEAGLFPSSNGDLENPGGETDSYLAVKVLETMTLTEENKSEVSDEREEGAVVTSPLVTNSRSKKMAVKFVSMTKEQELTESTPRKVVDTFKAANKASLFLGMDDLSNAGSVDSVSSALSDDNKSYEDKVFVDIHIESILLEELVSQYDENKSDALLEKSGDTMSCELNEVDYSASFLSDLFSGEVEIESNVDVELGKETGSLNQEENIEADTEAAIEDLNIIRELSGPRQTLSNSGLNVAELAGQEVPNSCNLTATPRVLTAKDCDISVSNSAAEKTPKKESALKAQVLEKMLIMGREKLTGATPSLFLGSYDLSNAGSVDSVSSALTEDNKSDALLEELISQNDENKSDALLEKGGDTMHFELVEVDYSSFLSYLFSEEGEIESNADVELVKETGSLNQEENVADTEAAIEDLNIIRELSGQALSNPGLNIAELEVPSSCNPTATPSVLTAKATEKTPKKESVLKTQVLDKMLMMSREKKTGATPGKSDEEKKPTEAAADKENNGGAYGLKKEGVKKPQNLKDMSLRKLRVMYKESFSALQPLDQNCLHGDGNARK